MTEMGASNVSGGNRIFIVGLKLMVGISSQRWIWWAESNGGLNGACSEAGIHNASDRRVIIGRGGDQG